MTGTRATHAPAPAGLVGAALAVWGIAVGQPWVGGAAALLFEAVRALRAGGAGAAPRPAAPSSFIRVTTLLVVVLLAYMLATRAVPHSLYAWLRWLPLLLLPLVLLQAAGRATRVGGREAELTHAYAAITLAAAGTGGGAGDWLYAAFAALVGWALLARAPRGRRAAGAAMAAVAAALGFGIQAAISTLQGQVEEWSTELLADLLSAKPDALRERTRIGDLGKIKLSDRIVMRVTVESARPAELLLRESSFDRYRNGEWQASRREAVAVPREGETWRLSAGEAPARLALRRALPGGEGLLALPYGTRAVSGLPAERLLAYPTGAVAASGTPRYLSLRVAYDPGASLEPPTAADLEVPELLRPVLARIVSEAGLASSPIAALRAFFARDFAYSLDLGDQRRGPRTLTEFLVRDRKGHCEYFASATVLLLRQAGVPARYVGGYSAQEHSAREDAFLVRARHAHAWAEAYVEGRWVPVDTTPSRWAELEGEAARGFLGPLLDRLSWLFDQAVQAWSATALAQLALALASIAGTALLAAAALRAARRRRARDSQAAPPDPVAAAWRALEARLARRAPARAPGESIRRWVARLQASSLPGPEAAALAEAASRYYRVRFDPASPPAAADDLAARLGELSR